MIEATVTTRTPIAIATAMVPWPRIQRNTATAVATKRRARYVRSPEAGGRSGSSGSCSQCHREVAGPDASRRVVAAMASEQGIQRVGSGRVPDGNQQQRDREYEYQRRQPPRSVHAR